MIQCFSAIYRCGRDNASPPNALLLRNLKEILNSKEVHLEVCTSLAFIGPKITMDCEKVFQRGKINILLSLFFLISRTRVYWSWRLWDTCWCAAAVRGFYLVSIFIMQSAGSFHWSLTTVDVHHSTIYNSNSFYKCKLFYSSELYWLLTTVDVRDSTM